MEFLKGQIRIGPGCRLSLIYVSRHASDRGVPTSVEGLLLCNRSADVSLSDFDSAVTWK